MNLKNKRLLWWGKKQILIYGGDFNKVFSSHDWSYILGIYKNQFQLFTSASWVANVVAICLYEWILKCGYYH